MAADLLTVLALAALAGGWVLLQRWLARLDPELPGIQRSCSGCPVPGVDGAGGCGGGCGAGSREAARAGEEPPGGERSFFDPNGPFST